MIVFHTVCSLLSYVAFLVAFLAGLLYLIQEAQLKRKQMGWLFHRLPALWTLDRLNVVAIGVGFGLLSLGLFSGLVGARLFFGVWWRWDSKELLSLVLWMTYLIVWGLRVRATLRGRKVALLSMLGFSLMVFTFLGVSRWFPTWHAGL